MMSCTISFIGFFAILLTSSQKKCLAQNEPNPEILRIDADVKKGFHSPYLLSVPKKVREGAKDKAFTFLVIPNNTGSVNDDFEVHEKSAKRTVEQATTGLGNATGTIVLVPIFPRPKKDWRIYAHALDRDSMVTEQATLKRPDLQLLAMIDHASEKLKGDGITIDRKILLFGFSASGMFVNRFVFLHPDRVKAAAFGSPGGWPMAPVASVQDKQLRYPLGVGDLEKISGNPFDFKTLSKVPLFVFMGDQDKNDSVIYRDSYEEEDEKLLGELFGTNPVDRWPHAEKLYRDSLPNAQFKLYPKVAHRVTKEMIADIMDFFAKRGK